MTTCKHRQREYYEMEQVMDAAVTDIIEGQNYRVVRSEMEWKKMEVKDKV